MTIKNISLLSFILATTICNVHAMKNSTDNQMIVIKNHNNPYNTDDSLEIYLEAFDDSMQAWRTVQHKKEQLKATDEYRQLKQAKQEWLAKNNILNSTIKMLQKSQ